jgi:hypothetical protein
MRSARVTPPFCPPRRPHRRSAPRKEGGGLEEVTSFIHGGGIEGDLAQAGYTISTDGKQRLNALSVEAGCAENTLASLMSEACEMDKKSEMDTQFVFFALQGGNVYKQPTDVRDFEMVQESSVPYHTSRGDYKMHGTIVKMPLPCMAAPDAIVCHVFKGQDMVAVLAALAEYEYEDVYSVM